MSRHSFEFMWTTCERRRAGHGLIIHLGFPSQYALTSTFMRLQEFYESPISTIRNHAFSLEEFMDAYAGDRGNFSYTSDWNGFNVPGHVVREFFLTFDAGNYSLLNKECDLRDVLGRILFGPELFYLIGTTENRDVAYNHELAHAYYYLDDEYRANMDQFARTFPHGSRKLMQDWFTALGYAEEVFEDELQAYLATDSLDDMIENWRDEEGQRMFDLAAPFRQQFDHTVAKIA